MTAAFYLAGAVFGCCVTWLLVASTGLGRDETGPSSRRVWLPVFASAAAVATFLIIRFVAVEAPVSRAVVMRGWLGFFFIFATVFAVGAALTMAVVSRVRLSRSNSGHQPSAR